jgi:putative FmdB family regulatory protein
MPIYDYACIDCGRVVEVVHGVNGHGPQACETCGGPMKKLLSSPAVHFKGSGWAKKDRGASNTTKAAARSSTGGETSDAPAGTGDGATTGPGAESAKSEPAGASTASGTDAS